MKTENFDKPLDTPLTEQKTITVKTPEINPETLAVTGTKEEEIQLDEKVVYTQLKPNRTYCQAHFYDKIQETKAGYVATCRDCEYGKFVNPIRQTIVNGKIIERK